MSFLAWVGVVSSIVTLLSFAFAVWIWMRSDMRVRELTNTLQAIFNISGDIMWEALRSQARALVLDDFKQNAWSGWRLAFIPSLPSTFRMCIGKHGTELSSAP